MKHTTWFRVACSLAATAAALVVPGSATANPIVPVTLECEREGLDLDAGTVVPIEPGWHAMDPAGRQPDLVVACNVERPIRAVVFHNRGNGVAVAHLDGVPFNRVGAADLAGLSFTAEIVDEPFGPSDSVVVRTDTGAHYLLGNAIENAAGVTFDTQLLDETTALSARPVGYETEKTTAPERGWRKEALRSGPAGLPRGLSAAEWRLIRWLIEEDGHGDAPTDRTVAGEPRLGILQDDRNAADPHPAAPASAEDTRLTASDGATGDLFGYSVAVDGDTALVGAIGVFGVWGPETGAAYVFTRSGTTWSEQAKLIPSSSQDVVQHFGTSVALSGDTALVGAFEREFGGSNAGSAYVFVRTGTTWTEQARLTGNPPASSDGFGASVALDGDTALVAAIPDDFPAIGSVYVFVRDGTTWSGEAKLNGRPSEGFGVSVALDGDTALAGAGFADHSGVSSAGSAYVFVRSGTTWSEQAQLTASDASPFDRLGERVALSGDTALAVAGAFQIPEKGSAYIFTRNGTTWSEQAKLTGNPGDFFAYWGGATLSGDTALVGASGITAAYVFARNGTRWIEQGKLVPSVAPSGSFGFSVALSGGTALVGAARQTGSDRGSAHVFTLNQAPVAVCRDAAVAADDNCQGSVGPEDVDDGSFDADGDLITLSLAPAGPFPLGDTSVTLTVTDDQGASDSCTATVTVQDTTPPVLSVSLDPDTLWPPNHTMIDVEAAVAADDACGTPSVLLVSVTSNEPDNGKGGGNSVHDIQDVELGTADFSFKLRAERSGGGDGRIYTAVYTATDAAGNTTSTAGYTVVPRDQGERQPRGVYPAASVTPMIRRMSTDGKEHDMR